MKKLNTTYINTYGKGVAKLPIIAFAEHDIKSFIRNCFNYFKHTRNL